MMSLRFARALPRALPRVPVRGLSVLAARLNVLEKYKAQLEKKAKELGVGSVDELKETLKDEIEAKKKEFRASDPLVKLEEYEKRRAELREKNAGDKVRDAIDLSAPKEPFKTLSLYLDVEKVKVLPNKELEYLWRARFDGKEQVILAVLNALQYANIFSNAYKNPSFILPLPRGDGYEMHFVQWAFVGPKTTHCMLTSLAEYKLHGEFAKPHTTLMFHLELVEDAGVVLMNGQVEDDAPLTMEDAQLLVLNVQRFYGGLVDSPGSKRKLALLEDFTLGNPNFDTDKLIEEAASMD